jgi:tetratricopeptide (TPR) repeat protein
MSKYLRSFVLSVTPLFGVCIVYAQTLPAPVAAKRDYSNEAFVIEQDFTRVAFENDGTSTRESTGRIRIQSDAGRQRYGVLSFAYQNSTESIDIDYVRVNKPDGSVVSTPADNIQDMAAEITRAAPFYSDLREKHVAVKGLSVGDVLEFRAHWRCNRPLAAGHFWYAFNFSHDAIILQQQLQISVPRDRAVNWKSPSLKPVVAEEGTRLVFTWTGSQLEHKPAEEEKKEQEESVYQAVRGRLPPPEVRLSSFQSWEEVGRWYGGLQHERVKPTAEIRAKAEELTRGASSEGARLRAIYNYVSREFRYIGIAFGIGRYQPHAAPEVLGNQYGDCKDKHTLLASLLEAAGIKAYPALISSAAEIDLDLPSPGQFDHLISVVPQGKEFLWLDTTPELAPFAYLITRLRDKTALVIPDNAPSTLMTTPTDPPVKAAQTFQIKATLDNNGTLQGKIERTTRGDDGEVLLRSAFRRLPLPQWKDLVQQISYRSGFAGDVSEVTVGAPENTEEPFRYTYSYTRKDFPDWSERRISSPLPPIVLPPLPAQDAQPSHPIWLGSPAEAHLESQVELPKGYTPELPRKLDLKEDFAEYHAWYAVKDGVLTTDRRFIVKLREVPSSEYEAYKKFSKAVNADHNRYITLSTGAASADASTYQDEIWELPYSENSEAARAYDEAKGAYDRHDLPGEVAALKRAVEIDPKFMRAWLWLGEIYKFMRQSDAALQAYRKAIEVDPTEPIGYKALGFTLMGMGKFEEALPVWQELVKRDPDNVAGPLGLGSSLFGLKRYPEAASALESAIESNPQNAALLAQLGTAYLRGGDEDKALVAYQKALEANSEPGMFNNIGYELADANKKLPQALEYAERAVREVEEASQKVRLSTLHVADLGLTTSLAAYWDTLGWVHFRLGNFAQAEKYLNASWILSQSGTVGDHLGQVYEKQNKREAAVQTYRLALAASSSTSGQGASLDEIRKRLTRLGADSAKPLYGAYPGGDVLGRARTFKLRRLIPGTGNAEVFLLLGPGSKVEDVKFISGSDKLKSAAKSLSSVSINQPFPDDRPTRLVRRGLLGCYSITGCSLVLLTPDLVRSVD